MLLDSTTRKLQIVLTAAKTANDMPVSVYYVDTTSTALPVPGLSLTNSNGVTAVDILAAPAASTQRKVNAFTVNNADTAAKTVQIYLDDNGTDYLLCAATLQVGDVLGYTDTKGWYVKDSAGSEKTTVQLAYSVVISALGFTPENVANKSTNTSLGTSDTLYPSENAVKTYIDNVAGGTNLDYFLSDTVSDVAGYYVLLNNPSGDAESNVAVAISANPTTIKTFATISTEPSITTLVSGVYSFHIHAAQTAGTQTTTIYANIYTRTSGGAETLRTTSETSATLSGTSTEYDLHFTLTSDIIINSTDRLVLEVIGIPAGAGTTPTVTIYMEGSTASRIEFRTTSTANDNRYLVKNGLSGGQTAYGGLNAGDDLLLNSTAHATKGYVGFGSLSTGFIYDEVNNRIGWGVVPSYFMHWLMPASDNFYIDARTNPRESTLGVIRLDHTANTPSTRPINLDIICAGHPDTHAVNVDYHASNIVAGDDSHVYDVHVDTSNSTGGSIAAIAVGKSGTGTVTVRAIEAYHGVEVIEQRAGSIAAIEQAWSYNGAYTDVTTAFGSAATDVQIFAANNDYIYIGMAGTFDDIEVILSIAASGSGIKPVFQYSIGGGSWTTFYPVDGSNGFRTNGNISWGLPLTGWATDTVNAVTKYWVRIQRTQTTLATPPTEDTIKVFSSTYYGWDENGDATIKSLTAANVNLGYTTTATSAGTTTLTAASNHQQFFTGTTTHTVVFPDCTTLVLGKSYYIHNESTGAVTVNKNGGAAVLILAAGTGAHFICTDISTAAGAWDFEYLGVVAASGKKVNISNTVTFAGTDGTTMTFPASSGTVLTAALQSAISNPSNLAANFGTGALTAGVTSLNSASSGGWSPDTATSVVSMGSTTAGVGSTDYRVINITVPTGAGVSNVGGVKFGAVANGSYTADFVVAPRVSGTYTEITRTSGTGFAVTGAISATTTILSSGATSGIGYTTGSGGTVTQATSRTTGVTINKINGEITLVSAAGSPSWQSFTVTNSAMAATDKVIPGQKSGTDKYMIHVTTQAAGSFEFTYATTGGTTTEQPVLTFAIIKGVAA